jgi:hypothetical protein
MRAGETRTAPAQSKVFLLLFFQKKQLLPYLSL